VVVEHANAGLAATLAESLGLSAAVQKRSRLCRRRGRASNFDGASRKATGFPQGQRPSREHPNQVSFGYPLVSDEQGCSTRPSAWHLKVFSGLVGSYKREVPKGPAHGIFRLLGQSRVVLFADSVKDVIDLCPMFGNLRRSWSTCSGRTRLSNHPKMCRAKQIPPGDRLS
jgi:hypothetical protein